MICAGDGSTPDDALNSIESQAMHSSSIPYSQVSVCDVNIKDDPPSSIGIINKMKSAFRPVQTNHPALLSVYVILAFQWMPSTALRLKPYIALQPPAP